MYYIHIFSQHLIKASQSQESEDVGREVQKNGHIIPQIWMHAHHRLGSLQK
jgi:hypothetical protein